MLQMGNRTWRSIALLGASLSIAGCVEQAELELTPVEQLGKLEEPSNQALVMKPVKVCGRRPNAGSPQSWWVDTGIYVKAGTSVTVDGASPAGGVQPWAGTAWPPAGNPGNTNWTDSLAYRSGLTSPTENVSFSLIAKVGRAGVAFRIGTQLTFNAPASGTLYLAFNDGVNFEDNIGSWSVNVTYPATLSFGTGYGTEAIYADRINTSLVDAWGVVLTVRDGNPGLTWTPDYVDNVVAALAAVQGRLGVPLKQVFGGLELRLTGIAGAGSTTRGATTASFIRLGAATRGAVVRTDNRSWGQRSPPAALDYYPSLIPYGLNNVNDKGIQNTIIHEMGHILEYRTMGSASASSRMWDVGTGFGLLRMRQSTSTTVDATNDLGVFWEAQVSSTSMVEIVADSFLNWVRNSYVGMIGQIDAPLGPLTVNQQKAAFFWNGGTIGTTTSPGWAGAGGFRATAANFVTTNQVPAFLTSLGNGYPAGKRGGDPDPTCAF